MLTALRCSRLSFVVAAVIHRFTCGNQVQFLSDTLLMAFAFRKPKVLQGVPDGSRDIEAYRVGAGLCQVKRWRQP